MLGVTISIIHVENIFYSLDTLEEAFAEILSYKPLYIVSGSNSAIIGYQTAENEYSYNFYLKIERGYRETYFWETKEIYHVMCSFGNFTIYNVKNTDDYYLMGIYITAEDTTVIIDSTGKSIDYTMLSDNHGETAEKIFDICEKVEYTQEKYFVSFDGTTTNFE